MPCEHMSQRMAHGGLFGGESRMEMLEKWFDEPITLERGH